MIRRATRQGWLGRLLALLAAVFLLAGPMAPAMAQTMMVQTMDDCCPDTACHDLGGHGADKSSCPTACAVACVIVPAPDQGQVESPPSFAQRPSAPPAPRLRSRAIAPEQPPPR